MTDGRFISFEGGEGTGKSTQVDRLFNALVKAGYPTVKTREPGGAPGAEAIRKLLVEGEADRWSPIAETLLFAAARDDHVRRTIRPALDAGNIVLCDRFADSTRAYQGAAGGVDEAFVRKLEGAVVGSTVPDLTLILDLDPETGLGRVGRRTTARQEARFEAKSLDFHRRLRSAYLEIAASEPERCVVIDAGKAADEVTKQVIATICERWPLRLDRTEAGAEHSS